jgi:hypothetical protein
LEVVKNFDVRKTHTDNMRSLCAKSYKGCQSVSVLRSRRPKDCTGVR